MLQSKRNKLTISILGKLRKQGMPTSPQSIEDIPLLGDNTDEEGPEESESNNLLPLEPSLRRKRKPTRASEY